MKTETEVRAETKVSVQDNWVSGTHNIYTGELHNQLDISLFLHARTNGVKVSLDIDRNIWVGSHYIPNDLARLSLSMPELKALAKTLNDFIKAYNSGEIQAK